MPRTIVTDWLAPQGCMQYFVQPTGTIETFNLAEGVGKLNFIDNHSNVKYSLVSFLIDNFLISLLSLRSLYWQHELCHLFPTFASQY